MIKRLLLPIALIGFFLSVYSQGDTCATALALPAVNTNCTYTTYTNATATDSGVVDPGCANYNGADVWFSVVVPAGGAIIIDTQSGVITDSGMALYSGTCGALTLIDCDDDGGTGLMSNIFATGLTAGSTVYIRVWEYGGNNNGTFDLCVYEPPPPPPNDECTGALSVTVNPDQSCASTTAGTIESATDSGVSGSGCFGTADDDVWFSFVATGTAHTIDLLNVTGSTTDLYHAVYSGSCAAPGAAILCSDPNSSIVGGLTAGNTYFVQVYSWSSSGAQTTDFDICIGTPPPPPPNDSCASAITINCTTSNLSGTTASSTSATHGTGCLISDYGVWYEFTGDGNEWTISSTANPGFDHELAIAEGSCGSLTNIACQDSALSGGTETYTVITTVGTQYYVYIAYWSSGGTATNTGGFDISVSCAPPCTTGSPVTTTVGCPSVDAGGLSLMGADPPPITCNSGANCVDLEATYLSIGETTDYIVEQIQYNPPIPIGNLANPISVNVDDVWSPVINLPFTFCFYGNTYTSVIIGSNGIINFDTSAAGTGSGWAFSDDLPSTNGALYENSIYGVYHDIDPSLGGDVSWELVTLASGCQALVAAWHDVPMFDNGNFGDGSKLYSGMIVLYEDTNVIEVYIENKEVDDGPWNGGNAIVGIQNATATQAVVAPCRNALDTNWTATNEAWRFVPDGNSITSITWYEGSGTTGPIVGTTDVINVCPGATTVYTAEVVYDLCNSPTDLIVTEETTVTVTANKIWNGSANNDWNNANNWTPFGVPDATDCVVIPDVTTQPVFIDPGAPLPINPGFALNLTVESDATLDIDNNSSLMVTEWVNVQPNALLTVRDGSSLVQNDNIAVNIGDIRMERNVSSLNVEDYVYWSSPVDGFALSAVSPGTDNQFLWHWIPSVGNNFGEWQNTTENMVPGKGYIVRDLIGTPSPDTALFIGTPNNGVITRTITRGTYTGADYSGPGDTDVTALDDNWNLVGNPYPSAISYSNFMAHPDNNDIDGTIYLWTHQSAPSSAVNSSFYEDFLYNYNPNDYIEYNTSGSNPPGFQGNIAAGQSFFVLMLDSGTQTETISFWNAMRDPAINNTQFYEAPGGAEINYGNNEIERHRIWLDLIAPNQFATSTMFGYIEGATDENDRLFDGYHFPANTMSLYSLIETTPYSIQGKSLPFSDQDKVLIGLTVPTAGDYQIAINSLDGLFENDAQRIYLTDKYLNVVHDLRESPYEFFTEEGDFRNRFDIVYLNETLSDDEFESLNDITIISANDEFKITSYKSPLKNIIVYDLQGRRIFSEETINETQFIINSGNFATSAYFIEVELMDGRGKTKKVVN